jgi:hypothetical protein
MSTGLKPIQDTNNIESTADSVELPSNDQHGPEWPLNIQTTRSNSTVDDACEFGAVAYDPHLLSTPPPEFRDLEFIQVVVADAVAIIIEKLLSHHMRMGVNFESIVKKVRSLYQKI